MFKEMKIQKMLEILIFIGLLFLITLIFFQKVEFTSVDLGRHLENGKIVWQDTGVLFDNFYSYTESEFPFINHHWLSGVIYYFVYLIGGFKLLSILNILLILGTFCLAFKLTRKRVGFNLASLLALPVIFLLSSRTEVRPEIFSYLFIFLTWFVIEKVSEKKNYRLLWWLLPLFLLWVNMHIYFFLGLILVGFKAASEFLPTFIKKSGDLKARLLAGWRNGKAWILNFLYLTIICVLNPNTFSGLLYPFNIFKNYGYEIAENKTIFYLEDLMINYNFTIFKILLLTLIISWIVSFFFRKKIRWFELGISILFIFIGLFSSRNISIFGLVALVIISSNLAPILKHFRNKNHFLKIKQINYQKELISAGLIILILGSAFYLVFDSKRNNNFFHTSLGLGLYEDNEDSIKFFRENNLSGPIFNNYDLGSALIFWLYPQEKVFVDNRPEAYTNEFFSEIYKPMQEDDSSWLKYSEEYGINLIYFSHTDSTPWASTFLFKRLNGSDWPLIYFDRTTVIMIKNNEDNRAVIDEFEVDSVEIGNKIRELVEQSDLRGKLYLANLARVVKQADLSEEIYRNILLKQPKSRQTLYALGSLYSSSSDRLTLLDSLKYLRESLNQGYHLPAVYNQMALVNWKLESYISAEDNWREALKMDRGNVDALYYLEQINQLRSEGKLPVN